MANNRKTQTPQKCGAFWSKGGQRENLIFWVFPYTPKNRLRGLAFQPVPLSDKPFQICPTGSRPGLCVLA